MPGMLGAQQPGGLQLGGGLGLASQAGGLRLGLGGLGQQPQTAGGLQLGGGLGLGQQATSMGTGLQLGTGLGQQQMGTGLGLGLGQQQASGLMLGGGLGLGQQQQQLRLGGLGTGTGLSTGLGMGIGQGTGLGGLGQQRPTGLGLAGLSLASSQKNTGQGIFSQPTLQQQQHTQLALHQATQAQLMLNAVKAPGIFGDERDLTVQKFNLVQANCGTGKGLANYIGQTHAIAFTTENPFCRFKTVCYSRLPSSRNEDGLVALQFSKPDSSLFSQQEAVVKSLQEIVATSSVQVMVDSIRPLPDNCSEMTIYILERSAMGGTRPLRAADVFMFLHNASRKTQLERLGVIGLYPKTGFSEENLKLYLQNPPPGITSQLWEQSKRDNPDPQKYIPVPVIGSTALLKRMKHQEQETAQHQSRLEIITDEILELQRAHATTLAKIAEYKRKLVELSHRVLRVMVAQETLRKSGYSVQQDEEQLRIRLESIQAELNAPLQFKGRLNELMSQIRMQTQVPGGRQDSRFSMDPVLTEEIHQRLKDKQNSPENNISGHLRQTLLQELEMCTQHLEQQQGALSQLVKIIKEDFEDLKCVEEGFTQT